MGSAARDEVESALAAFPGVAGVAVTAPDSRLADQNLVAYVAPDGPGLDMAELRAHARKILPASRTPVAIVLVDEIPVTAAGAVDVAALPAPELDGLLPYRAPATARQGILCDLFAEVLGVARCGMDNDFFDLGGRSVEAMMLAGRISVAFGVRMSMADLFKASTAADMDRRLDLTADARR